MQRKMFCGQGVYKGREGFSRSLLFIKVDPLTGLIGISRPLRYFGDDSRMRFKIFIIWNKCIESRENQNGLSLFL